MSNEIIFCFAFTNYALTDLGSLIMDVELMETTAVHFLPQPLPSGVPRIAVTPNYWSLTLWETIHIITKD